MIPEVTVIPGERAGNRVARWVQELLEPGPLSEDERVEDYRALVSCGLDPDGGVALSRVRTSCAIFVRAVLHWCGITPARHPWRAGQPMCGGWIPMRPGDHAWRKYDPRSDDAPLPGDVFFVQAARNLNDCHVGIFAADLGGGRWRTAEGGGGRGTRCRLGLRTIGVAFDHRPLRGWWSTDSVGTAAAIRPPPATTPPGADPSDTGGILRRGSTGPAVASVQRVVGVVADGVYGPRTEAAVRAWQASRGLVPDGVVGPLTRETFRGR